MVTGFSVKHRPHCIPVYFNLSNVFFYEMKNANTNFPIRSSQKRCEVPMAMRIKTFHFKFYVNLNSLLLFLFCLLVVYFENAS